MDAVPGGNATAEKFKKRSSKWDVVAEVHVPTDVRQEPSHCSGLDDLCHDKERNSGWNLSKNSDGQSSKFETKDDSMARKSDPGLPRQQSVPGNKTEWRDGDVNKDWGERSPTRRTWDENKNYSRRMSTDLDAWRQRSGSKSPRDEEDRSRRSRSRSRSRSPSHKYRRESESWNGRSRVGTGRSAEACRNFAAGRCWKGSQCRYLHDDDDRRHSDYRSTESREARYNERRGTSGQSNSDVFSDPHGQRAYSRDRNSYGYSSHYDREKEKPDDSRNNRSSISCTDFMKGRCYRGSECRYVHHRDPDDGGRPVRESTMLSSDDRRDTGILSGQNQRRESQSVRDTPCKYFFEGRCRNGDRCRFSHEGSIHGHSEGRSFDDRKHRGTKDESRLLEGMKWGDKTALVEPMSPDWRSNNGNARVNPHESGTNKDQYRQSTDMESKRDNGDLRSWNSEEDIKCQVLLGEVAKIAMPTSEQVLISDDSGQKLTAENSRLPHDNENTLNKSVGSQNVITIFATDQQNILSVPEEGIKENPQSQYTVQQTTTSQNSNLDRQSNPIVTLPSFNGLSQQILHLPHKNAQSFNSISSHSFNVPSQQTIQSLPTNSQVQHMVTQPLPSTQTINPANPSQQIALTPNFISQTQQIIHHLPPPNGQNANQSRASQYMIPQATSKAALQTEQDLISKADNTIGSKSLSTLKVESGSQVLNSQSFNSISSLPFNVPSQQTIQSLTTNSQVQHMVPQPLPSAQIIHPVNQSQQVAPSPNFIIQTQQTFPQLPHPNGESENYSGPSQYMIPQSSSEAAIQSQTNGENLISKPDDTTSSNSLSNQKTVSSEQVAQLTNLSASLAQIFGNSHQLPQLYAALNPPNASYISANKNGGEEENPDHVNHESKPIEMLGSKADPKEENETVTEKGKKEQQTTDVEDAEPEAEVDAGNKKTKEAKEVRNFKFALVEFVKDLLRRSWKEGHLTKESHKTIVKKVVDKVVAGVMKSSTMPETQEKIDLYLTHSKPKLSKLVQAYVLKYMKS
ncbi:Zinc finger CCCH domain-containing protein 55 [Acorus gramineus]|uniref:Zinc finger CCCH domain-containing protein 55 n=1 Tax=Acorus gramineus TaxID=55184 RepID=A0AAV9BW21_ACOGR|nr:Zinc finger CCCH domain-containing protein 55 [Acorus gramineus]